MAASKLFSLEGKGLKLNTAEDIEPHIQALKDSTDVEEVVFIGNTLGIGACEALAKVLETKKTLRVVNLADIFTSRLLAEIPPALDALLQSCLTLPLLHTVNLSDNAFGLNTVAPLVSFLSAHVPLQHLILNNNGLGPAAGTQVADALTTLAEKKTAARAATDTSTTVPDLETVICGRNRLENGSMEAWARAYKAHDKIKEIKMVQNGIRQEGITHLLRNGLVTASALRTLDLQDNTFTAMGARALADVVGGWGELRELGVGDCLLGKKGGVMLGNALGKGKNELLEILRLQYNDIDKKGIDAIAEAQCKLPQLRRLELNGNKFNEDDDSVEKMREVFDERKEAADPEFVKSLKEDEAWGLDELDELESEDEDEDEEEDDEEADEEEAEKEKVLERADQAEQENVAQKKDGSVDQLADLLGKTGI
ncbi:RNI-like protein [Saccharata proteae CBS 121410]|uniref:RNI-like protein n=1 Tax=Saccharata proteae CBS 121410 TaxID=1314787 RepID=A0A9P4HXE9_9PEZI|nr:RNI-like protein [Saccharata proteae CBS 121410]